MNRAFAGPQREIVSPCVKICAIDPVSGLCGGCGRTLDEIARWMVISDSEREAIMLELPQRRARDNQPR